MTYYNTNRIYGAALRKALNDCKSQEQMVLTYMKAHPEINFAPHQLAVVLFLHTSNDLNDIFHHAPITSIRRAITNLTSEGYLVKTDKMVKGPYGKQVHTWKYNKHNYF